ncbi:MAG: hypothetical protein Q7S86_04490 [bacterium]|nr:hypothetical protein [bacterium]
MLHRIENHVLGVFQMPMEPPFAGVYAGKTDLVLLQFGAWSNTDVAVFVTFEASQGSLDNAENYRLVHEDYWGFRDIVITGSLFADQLFFSFGVSAFQGGTWSVLADIKSADNLTPEPSLQLAFVTDPWATSAFDYQTWMPMQGFGFNGYGAGQVQLFAQAYYATWYTIVVPAPAPVVALELVRYVGYPDQTVVAPLTQMKVAHFVLTNNTPGAINLNEIELDWGNSIQQHVTNLFVRYGTRTTTVKPTVAQLNPWSIDYTLSAGQSIDIMVFGDIHSDALGYVANTVLVVRGTQGSHSFTSVASGQKLSFVAGAFATAFDGVPASQAVAGNQQVLAGRFKLTSSFQDYSVKEMRFTTEGSSVISSATLKDAVTGATLATVTYNTINQSFNFTGLNFAVFASTAQRVDLYWNLAVPSATNGTSNVDTKAALTYVKYIDPNGTESIDTNTRTGNTVPVYKSVPTIIPISLPDAPIVNGTAMKLYQFTVSASSQGPVDIKQFKLDVNWTDDMGANFLQLGSLRLLKDGVDITSSVSIMEGNEGLSVEGTNGFGNASRQVVVRWDGSGEDTVSAGASTTYTVIATPQGFGLGDSVSLVFKPDPAPQTAGYNYLNTGTSLTGIIKLFSMAGANASAENANLIWSDESAVAHSASTNAGTGDWSNGYLIPVAFG